MPAVTDLNNTVASQTSLVRGKKFRLDGIKLFEAGIHKGITYTVQDIDRIVLNFMAFSNPRKPMLMEVPVVLGHEQAQILLDMTGHPSAGWVQEVWADWDVIEEPYINENDEVKWRQRKAYFLFGAFWKVPEEVAQWITDDTYRYLSCEFSKAEKPPPGVPAVGPMLLRVAILGATQPYVKSLGTLPKPTLDVENQYACFADSDPETKSVITLLLPLKGVTFSEEPTVNETVKQGLMAMGCSDEVASQMAAIDPAKYAGVAKCFAAPAAPVDGAGGNFDRTATIEKMSALPNADREAISKMSDDELKAYAQKMSHAADNDPGNNDPANPGEGGKGTPAPTYSQGGKFSVTPGNPAPDAVAHTALVATKKLESEFSDFRAWKKEQTAKQAADAKARQEEEYRQADSAITVFCQDMVTQGRITPAEAPSHVYCMKQMVRVPNFKVDVVKFSQDGKEVSGSRLDEYKAMLASRAVMRFSQPRPVSGEAGGKPVSRAKQALAKTAFGREVLAKRAEMAAAPAAK